MIEKRCRTVVADGTPVTCRAGIMPGVPAGTPAIVRHEGPKGPHPEPRIVWLELDDFIQWSHGQSEHKGYWACPLEYDIRVAR